MHDEILKILSRKPSDILHAKMNTLVDAADSLLESVGHYASHDDKLVDTLHEVKEIVKERLDK